MEKPQPIQTREQYDAYLEELEYLISLEPEPELNSEEGIRIEQLVDVLEPYEKVHWPMSIARPRPKKINLWTRLRRWCRLQQLRQKRFLRDHWSELQW